MAYCDNNHHEIAKKILTAHGINTVDSTVAEDQQSIADLFMLTTEHIKVPLGLKHRGKNSGSDFNLTAWSEKLGNLPEFSNAGKKFYMYWMKEKHVLVQFHSQSKLNELLPDKWKKFEEIDRRNFAWINQYSGIRKSSPYGSPTTQGVVYVPVSHVDIIQEWDLELRKI